MRSNPEAIWRGLDCRVPVSQLIYHGPSRKDHDTYNEGSPGSLCEVGSAGPAFQMGKLRLTQLKGQPKPWILFF